MLIKNKVRFFQRALLVVFVFIFYALWRRFMGYTINAVGIREIVANVSLILLLLSFIRWGWIWAYCFLISIPALVYGLIGLTYGIVDVNAIVAFKNTNPSETLEFIKNLPLDIFVYYFVYVLLLIMLFLILSKSNLDWTKNKWVRIVCLVLLFSIGLSSEVRTFLKNQDHTYAFTGDLRISEISTLQQIRSVLSAEHRMTSNRSVLDRSVHWNIDSHTRTCEVCVLVIGESARRDFMGAYDGPWKNTPWMSRVPGKLFTNFNSASCGTAPSLSVELYAPDPNGEAPWGDNIVSLAKKAGFHTAWLSNQDKTGANDSPVTMSAFYADNQVFEVERIKAAVSRSDTSLIPDFAEALKQPGKLLVVVHLWGSHPLACRRTQDKYTEWVLSKEVSCYIESIRQTDALLSNFYNLLKKKADGRSWSMLYTSDHGLLLDKGSDGWTLKHGWQYQQNYEVPLFITSSWDKRRVSIGSERSGRYFVPMLADWLGIKAKTGNEYSDRAMQACDWLQDVACEDQDKVRKYFEPFKPKREFEKQEIKTFLKTHQAE